MKHTVADNLDLRYEFFPKSSEQFMVGMFYKRLKNPIEYGLLNEGQDTYYKPMNFGNATNLGVEVDVMKYFNWFGIKPIIPIRILPLRPKSESWMEMM